VGKFTIRRAQQILAEMIAQTVARTDMNDVSDTSVTKHILAAAARQDAEQYFQMYQLRQLFSIDTATGDDLDARAAEVQPSGITRIPAAKATGQVVFSRAGTSGTVTISIGSKVKTADGVIFTTTTAGSITPSSAQQIIGHGVGRDSNLVTVVADLPGTNGNVVANTVIKFVIKPSGVDEVTNPSAFSLGFDKETDDAFRARIKNYIRSLARSTIVALESGVLGAGADDTASTIRYSKAVEDLIDRGNVTLYIDDGSGTAETYVAVSGEVVTADLAGPPPGSAVGGETQLWLNYGAIKESPAPVLTSSVRGALVANTDYFLNSATGQINFDPALVASEVITASYTRYTGLIAEAQKIVDGDPDDPENYPGLRAAGILVKVRTPQVLIQTVVATITVKEGYSLADTRTAAKQAIMDYINTLGISGDVVRSEMIKRVMSVAGIYDVTVGTPASNVVLLDDQLARTTSGNVTVS
jgi:uncharacterized phage protein gp47/JayE